MKNFKLGAFIPIMLAFFVMGYVDMVGVATNNIKADFNLSDTVSGFLPSMVFLWFLVLSVPTSLIMNRIGRRKTVVLSLVFTMLAMVVPIIGYNFPLMLVAFALLGIGNTLMQVSLNPLVTNVVSDKKLASSLTFGQFIKAIASFLAPIIASWASLKFGNWRLLFPIFAVVSLIPIIWLYFTPIEEKQESKISFKECFGLLSNSTVLLLFIGILVHVGIDVGMNLTGPKVLMERTGLALEAASYATVVYFIFRTIGTFLGTFILSFVSARKFFMVSVSVMLAGIGGLFFANTSLLVYTCVAMLGIGNSNVFPIIFSRAMQLMPSRNNEISGLLIMGVSGGAVFPLLMGVASDAAGSQNGAAAILALCVAYLVFLSSKIK